LKVCSTPGCPNLAEAGRCSVCRTRSERARGTARQRGYDSRHERRFRDPVLTREPMCTCVDQTRTDTHRHTGQCLAPSTVADHYPRDKRELRRLGLDENNPRYGRGLCKVCHDHWTAVSSPGGWHQRHA
jgi:5-methylcytosine-specific restriction protein A